MTPAEVYASPPEGNLPEGSLLATYLAGYPLRMDAATP